MKRGDMGIYSVPEARCETPDGAGTVVNYEVAYDWPRRFFRIGVILDKNPFFYPIAYYPPDSIKGYFWD